MASLIAHGLIIQQGKVLVIKRSLIKRSKPNFAPERWDFPGGTVEQNESPQDAVVREAKEEVGLTVKMNRILYDSYHIDISKGIDFLTIVYLVDLIGKDEIFLDQEEHTDYEWLEINDILNGKTSLDFVEYVRPSLEVFVNSFLTRNMLCFSKTNHV
jgi:8-oxo-dGTP diphosphatase